MKNITKALLVLLGVLYLQLSFGQDIDGLWEGTQTVSSKYGLTKFTYPISLVLERDGDQVIGLGKVEANGKMATFDLEGKVIGEKVYLRITNFIETYGDGWCYIAGGLTLTWGSRLVGRMHAEKRNAYTFGCNGYWDTQLRRTEKAYKPISTYLSNNN